MVVHRSVPLSIGLIGVRYAGKVIMSMMPRTTRVKVDHVIRVTEQIVPITNGMDIPQRSVIAAIADITEPIVLSITSKQSNVRPIRRV